MRKRGSWNKSKNEIINACRAPADVQAQKENEKKVLMYGAEKYISKRSFRLQRIRFRGIRLCI